MTGIYLLVVVFIWVAFVIWVGKISTEKLPMATWRIPVASLIIAALLPLPLIDEIVGGKQFEKLCKENSTIQVDRTTAAGRTIFLAKTVDVEIKGTWVRIIMQPRKFIDASTGETVVSYNDLIADGGHFISTLGISEGGVPLTFKGWCHPGDQYTLKELFKEIIEVLAV